MKSSDPQRWHASRPADHEEVWAPMANQKPTAGPRTIRLDMSIEYRMILRRRIETWPAGDKEVLETPENLSDPDATRRRVAAYGRLIDALKLGKVDLPDEEARALLNEALVALDEAREWEEDKVDHDSLAALLSAVGGPIKLEDNIRAEAAAPTTSAGALMAESAVLRRVLEVHPCHRSEVELVLELVEEEPGFQRDAVERAIRDLVSVGLLHIRDDLITPTRAALRSVELQGR